MFYFFRAFSGVPLRYRMKIKRPNSMTKYGKAIGDWIGTSNDGRPYYLVVTDAEGRMSFTNAHFYSSFQAAQAPPIRNSFFNLVHENDRQQLMEALSRCSLRQEAVNTEFRVRNGHFRWVKWELSGIRKPENMSEQILCLGKDMANAPGRIVGGEAIPSK
jgi:PAS domain S-box-containing protein